MELNPKIYKLESGRFQVSYHNPVSRKRIRKKFQSLAEAEGFNEDLVIKFTFQTANYSSADSVHIWLKRYLALSPNAFITRQGKPFYESFLKSFGHISALSVTETHLIQWLKDFQVERSYSVKTMPNIKSAINQFFQFIVDSKALAVNPMVKVAKLEGLPSKSRVVLTQVELSELLNKVKATSPDLIYPVIFLMAHTGARLGEILNLKWNNVHFEFSAIQLLWTKNGEDRLIQISDEVLSFLKSRPQINDNVVLSQYQKPWTHSIYRKQFNKFRHKIGFHKYWCNHVLRHTYATNYLLAGGDMLQLQKILGHKSLEMTVDLYGQIEARDVQDISPYDF
ncbi:MAG: site-specific integrase [Pseudobdellovibrio sp.]